MLYGDGSCGLNVHTPGHLTYYYVKLLGPLWAWSSFPLEDNNNSIISSVHGTGNVLRETLRYKEAKQMEVSQPTVSMVSSNNESCALLGSRKKVTEASCPGYHLYNLSPIEDFENICKIKIAYVMYL